MMTYIDDDYDDTDLDDLHIDDNDNADGSRNGVKRPWGHFQTCALNW